MQRLIHPLLPLVINSGLRYGSTEKRTVRVWFLELSVGIVWMSLSGFSSVAQAMQTLPSTEAECAALPLEIAAQCPSFPNDSEVVVTGFQFGGNTLLTDQELKTGTAAFTGRITLKRLSEVASAIARLYAARGYRQVEVSVPTRKQNLTQGILRVAISEDSVIEDNITEDKLVIRKFDFIGNEAIATPELEAATRNFLNKPLSFDELLQVRSVVSQLYNQQGFFTSGAYIPVEQEKSKDGIVTIRIVEGDLGSICFTGTRRIDPQYLASLLILAMEEEPGWGVDFCNPKNVTRLLQKPLQQDRLLAALRYLQRNPQIESLTAELSAGTGPGKNNLDVQIRESNPFRTQLRIDNGRSPSVGSIRRQLEVGYSNLLKRGDDISLAYTNTNGSNALDFAFSVPVGGFPIRDAYDDRIILKLGSTLSNRIIEPPFNQLDIKAPSFYGDFTFRRQIVQTLSYEFALNLTASYRESKTSVFGFDIPISPGADADGRTRVAALRFSGDWIKSTATDVFSAQAEISLGLSAGTINKEPPDSRFLAVRGQGQWVRLLGSDTLFKVRSGLQIANRELLPLEQFGLGGQDTVRGYRQDFLLTDNGAFVSAELQIPILRLSRSQILLQVVPFVDAGTGWNSSGTQNPDPRTLVAAGVGLQFRLGDRVSARLDWGIPLVPVELRGRTLQEQGIYFSILWQNPVSF